VLHLPCAADASPATIRNTAWAWWLGQARSMFTERLQHYAPALGVAWRSLRLTNARTRWGSAKRDGSLMLNAKLLHYPLPVVDYVVVHELAHLHEMNHSPRFWSVVRSVMPDYEGVREQLRHVVMPE
jgi:predicted metal-dependent hydrolase